MLRKSDSFKGGWTRLFAELSLLFICFSMPSSSLAAEVKQGSRRMPDSPFWSQVYPIGTIDFQGYPDDAYQNRQFFWYHLYRDPDGDWFLMGNGNGQLWKLDSNRVWNRLDNTFFTGYDFNSYMLFPGMKYGGYGYWRTNGMLFNYREKTGEWELVPLSRELPIFGQYCFYDFTRHTLMQTGSYAIITAEKTSRVMIDSLFELDLLNRDWTTIGALNPEAEFFLSPAHALSSLETAWGRWLYSSNGDTCAHVNYLDRHCLIPSQQARKRFREACERKNEGCLLISTRNALLVVDTSGFVVVDTIPWTELTKNPLKAIPMLKPVSSSSTVTTSIAVGATALLAIAGGWTILKRRRSGRRPEKESEAGQDSPEPLEFVLSQHDGTLQFNGIALDDSLQSQEAQLLRILIDKKKLGQALNTVQFNELLGIDTRSPDNQKKIRSEIVKGLNTAFRERGFTHDAVRRIRHAEDRRMMMYFLHDSIYV